MSTGHRHTIHQHHYGWDNSLAPAVRIAPGESLEFDVADAAGGQLGAASTVLDVGRLNFAKINPVNGPVFVDGAAPGDVLKITLLEFAPSGWGWTANIPGFGLLADEFKEPALHLWQYDAKTLAPALFGRWGKVPLKPFTGTIGVAPAEPGMHSVVPPRRVGGNMDVRDIALGTELFLPVEVAGALFSVGDTHAAQGDGEVCGTAIESPMRVALRFDLLKQQPLSLSAVPHPGTREPASRCEGLRGGHRHRSGSDAIGTRGRALDDRPADASAGHARDRCVPALQRVRRSAHQRNRRFAELDGIVLLAAGGVRLMQR